jgi:adenylate cyclase
MGNLNFFSELKRRNVLRMAGLYLVGAWLLTQVASTLLPAFDAPSWALRGLIITLALGFIPAVILSWVFQLTPQGLKREDDVAPEQSITPRTGRRMDRMIIVVLVLALGYFAFDKFVLARRREAALVFSAVPNESKFVISAKSIAVLPFENLSSDKENAYFTDGVQDEILTDLAKIADLKVISRASVMQYKTGIARNLRKIGEELGVANVVEGSVQRAANKVRVNAQLIDARNDAHLWAKPTIAIWPMCSPSKAKSRRRSPTSCRPSSRLTRRKPSSSRPPLIWRLSTFTAGRSHFSSRQVSA